MRSAYTPKLMQESVTVSEFGPEAPPPPGVWRRWWRRQTPVHQDRFAMLAKAELMAPIAQFYA